MSVCCLNQTINQIYRIHLVDLLKLKYNKWTGWLIIITIAHEYNRKKIRFTTTNDKTCDKIPWK